MERIALLAFDDFQLLDLTAPYEVFSSISNASVEVITKTGQPVKASSGLELSPTSTFDRTVDYAVVCVPGGKGITAVMNDAAFLQEIADVASRSRFISSVCTGALILGAAGLLKDKRATTHWNYHFLLREFGAIPVKQRVVQDGNLFTGGGVTAGLDFALTIAGALRGSEEAQSIQLGLEYAPAPPFECGSPDSAPPAVVQFVEQNTLEVKRQRAIAVKASVRRLMRQM
jgi:cyclohexyl-isocyanide hydratase